MSKKPRTLHLIKSRTLSGKPAKEPGKRPEDAPAPELKNVKERIGGYRVTIERLDLAFGRKIHCAFGVKTPSQAVARRKARLKSGFLRVVHIEPVSTEEFGREFPRPSRAQDALRSRKAKANGTPPGR